MVRVLTCHFVLYGTNRVGKGFGPFPLDVVVKLIL